MNPNSPRQPEESLGMSQPNNFQSQQEDLKSVLCGEYYLGWPHVDGKKLQDQNFIVAMTKVDTR